MGILIICAIIGLLPAYIAHTKGRDFFSWWLFGAALFIIALPVAIFIGKDNKALEARYASEGMVKCPYCAEWIKEEAKVCRYCNREQSPIIDIYPEN